ncbi:MAG: transcriptional regulator [Frankiales bacterium]|jgi:two-component system nitrate/nitrite response regulator NarL|nr:transcriptional regulator [Frankiales bacterium]MCW2587530.1 transcriptional regulator [Frankiales bacterium]
MRVLLCDDHVVFAEAVAAYLSVQEGIEDVKVVSTASAVLRQVRDVDILLLDLDLSSGDTGLDVVEAVANSAPGVAVLLLTGSPDPVAAANALALGARGFLTKDCQPTALVDAVRRVADGETVIADALVGPVLRALTTRQRTVRDAEQVLARLTPREQEVLRLLGEGLTRTEIARRLRVSPHTARTHLQRLLVKLSLHSQLEAAAYARQLFQAC